MSRTVFVLGAGASFHCGTPLMNNFLEVAQDLLRLGEVDEVKKDFENVFDAIGNLHAIQSKAKINTYNIEDVYAAFEMGKLLGSLPGIGNNEIERLISSIRTVIAYTLERTTRFPGNPGSVRPSDTYHDFVGILASMMEAGGDCSTITFNYDLGLDYSLRSRGILCDYGLGDMDFRGKKSVTYLKLHGSVNWGKCTECPAISPDRQFSDTENRPGRDYNVLLILSRLRNRNCRSCGRPLAEDPFLVPPTWNKTAFHKQIDEVWKRATLELKDAENISVIGYSFPPTDLFFRHLFALGVDMKTILRGFYVYNSDPRVKERFETLLGSGIEQRFHFLNASFEVFVTNMPYIQQSLGIGL